MTVHRSVGCCTVNGCCTDDSAPVLASEPHRADRSPFSSVCCTDVKGLWKTPYFPTLARKSYPPFTVQQTPLKGRWPLNGGPTTFGQVKP